MLEAKPERPISDKANDSDTRDNELNKQGVGLIAPHGSNRKSKRQDGRTLRRYARRWVVERFFSWMQRKRRLLERWEYCPANFLGLVQLGALSILLKAFVLLKASGAGF